MLKKRIIPCLDIKDGWTVKGVNFEGLRSAGDPLELAKRYELEGADELVFLDITAGVENRGTLLSLVKDLAGHLSIPFTVGGGIRTLEDARKVIEAGADKISINSAAVSNPQLINDIAKHFGNQCVVLAVDTNKIENDWWVFTQGGRNRTDKRCLDWVKEAENRGAGEILLTSMAADGTEEGYSLEITEQVSSLVNIPVIASGGAGSEQDFIDVFKQTKATGALAASLFHFEKLKIKTLKKSLWQQEIPVRL